MKYPIFLTLLFTLLAAPLSAQAIDPATVPEIKKTTLGLYIEAKDVPEFLKKNPKTLFLDLRTPEELLFVGMPHGIDGNAPFGIMNYKKWDDKKKAFVRFPNPDFWANFEYWAIDKGTEIEVDMTEDWVDPIVGLRYVAPISEHWDFIVRGDIGGFGVGSDFTWHASAFATWQVSEHGSLLFGYRHMDVDYDDGSGSSRFRWDVAEGGPTVGFAWRF